MQVISVGDDWFVRLAGNLRRGGKRPGNAAARKAILQVGLGHPAKSEKKTTMKDKDVSKLLSLVLRHQPSALGIVLDPEGWTDVPTLLARMRARGMAVDLDLLKQVVATNDKQRFAFNADYSRIRANQGHSVAVDLGLTAVEPPEYLYHGTADTSVEAILQEGLQKQSRRHVHLSADVATATRVGGRHGKPVVLRVKSGEMHRRGGAFYRSENNVWLTDAVAPAYLEKWNGPSGPA